MKRGRAVVGGLLWPLCGKNRYTRCQSSIRCNDMQMNSDTFLSCGGLGGVKPAGLMGRCEEDIEEHWSVLLTEGAGEGFILMNFGLNETTLFRGV